MRLCPVFADTVTYCYNCNYVCQHRTILFMHLFLILPHVDCYHKSPHACECFATCCTVVSCSPLWMPQRCVANAVQLLHAAWLPPLLQSPWVVPFHVASCHTVLPLCMLQCYVLPHCCHRSVICCRMSYSCCHCVTCYHMPYSCLMSYSCYHCVYNSVMYCCMQYSCHCCECYMWPHAVQLLHVVQLLPPCMPQCYLCVAACCIVALRCTTCTVTATVYATVLCVASCHMVVSCCTIAATAYSIGLSIQLFHVALLVQFLPLNTTVLFVATCHTVAATVYATVLCVAACCTVASCCTVAATVYATVSGVAACCTVT